MTNATLNVLDTLFTTMEKVSEFDYVGFGERVAHSVITVAATVYAIVTYAWTALMLWWDSNGETLLKRAVQTVFLTVDFAGELLIAGRDFRKFANFATAYCADRVYFAVVR